MSLPNRFLLLSGAVLFLAFLAACSATHHQPIAPPGGSFSNSNLKGTYVFSVVGSDSLGDFVAMAGTLTADGGGNLTGGTFDVNNPNGAGLLPLITVQSGSTYHVTADGRGVATVKTSQGTFGFDFVLTSSESGMITEYDNAGTGSGTLELQSTVAQSDIDGKSYAFNLSGTSGVGSSVCGFSTGTSNFVLPFATAGAFTLDSSGNATGVADFNNNCFSPYGTNGTAITSGSVSVAAVPGTATFTSAAGTFTFDVYPVTSTHLKFVEVDATGVVTAGDAFTQAPAVSAAGANVFTIAGFDAIIGGPFTAVGIISSDGSSLVTAGSEDINDAGNVPGENTSLTGSYTALSGGRSVLTLSNFDNGANGLTGTYQFAAYPSTGGLQILEIDNSGTTSGIAYPQTATSVASAQGYGLNLTGANLTSEEDDIAEFINNNGSFTGLVDFNDGGVLTPDRPFTATYTPGSTADGRGTIASSSFNLVTYPVSASTSVFVEVDANPNPQVGLGSFSQQNAAAMATAAVRHLAVLRLATVPKRALKRR